MLIERETDYFDRYVQEEGDYDVLENEAYQRLLAVIKKRLNPSPGKKWLDLGCGTGAFSSKLSVFNGELSGVDISEKSIEIARSRFKYISFYCEDIRHTSLESGSFDFVVFSGVLHHLADYSTINSALVEAYRLLKPGGCIFSYDPHAMSPAMFLYRNPASPFYNSEGKTENEILINKKDIKEELKLVGFENIIAEGISGIIFRKVPKKAGKFLFLYNFYDKILQYSPLENLLGTFLIVTCSKPKIK